MRALRSCDFCGEQAVGTFEVIPDELDPTQAERRRVVLCEPCKDTLQTLIEPLIERAEEGTAGRPETAENDGTGGAGSGKGQTDSETNDLIESTADEEGSLLGNSDAAASAESGSEDTLAAEPGESTSEDSDSSESSGSHQSTESSGTVKTDRPDNYGQVLRLLRNREFPMTREEIVTIATSAYQLDARNVQAIIDEAIDRGEFVEANGQLQHA